MTNDDIRQPKSTVPLIFSRLERLHVVTGNTWEKIAQELGIDRSLIYHVKAGTRNLSAKVVYRLEQAEIAAGIPAPAKTLIRHGLKGGKLVDALTESLPSNQTGVGSATEIDQGFIEVDLEYRRGNPPSGQPIKIKINSPSNAMIWKLMGESGVLQDPLYLLLACLPTKYSKVEFLDRLTPGCYRKLVEAAMTLAFGLNWKNQRKVV